MRGGDVVGVQQGGGVRWGLVFEIEESVFGIGDKVGIHDITILMTKYDIQNLIFFSFFKFLYS